jgi:hypothetical protein
MANYEVGLKILEKAKIRPKLGKVIVLKLDGGKEIDAKIIRVENDRVIAASY